VFSVHSCVSVVKINNESMEARRIHGGVRKISFQLSG